MLAICGSLRADSYNRMRLNQAVEMAAPAVDIVEWDGLASIPPFSEDHEADVPEVVLELRAAIASADALLVVSPEYNGSIPGVLKNAIDWASRPRESAVTKGKPAAVIGASISPGGARRAHGELRFVLGRTGATVLDSDLSVPTAWQAFGPDQRLLDPAHTEALEQIVADLADVATGAVVSVP